MLHREVMPMTSLQERACQGLFVLAGVSAIGACQAVYYNVAAGIMFAGIGVLLLPSVFPVPAPGSLEDVFMRLRHWKPESGKPRPKLPYERD